MCRVRATRLELVQARARVLLILVRVRIRRSRFFFVCTPSRIFHNELDFIIHIRAKVSPTRIAFNQFLEVEKKMFAALAHACSLHTGAEIVFARHCFVWRRTRL